MAKRILITGCSSGIGRALAAELAQRGHEVIATARQTDDLKDLEAVQRLPLDVTSGASVDAAVAMAGPVDVLINNAGLSIWGPVESLAQADLDRIFGTNLFGMLRMLRAVLPGMRERGSGEIYQISSAIAKRPTALISHYAATKAALEAYSEALRLEVAPFGIKVCIVMLGAVESKIGDNRQDIVTPEYLPMAENVRALVAQGRQNPPSAESVAVRLADIIDKGNPPLRVNGTEDVPTLIAERTAQTDEQWETESLKYLWGPTICQ